MKYLFKLFVFLLLSKTFNVYALGESITISGSPPAFTINSAVAGQQPTAVTNATTTYGIATLLSITSITGRLNSNMPANVTLQVTLAAPAGATSAGPKNMTTTAQTLVSNIGTSLLGPALAITYRLSATAKAAKTTNATRTLTLTIQ